jgi:hypothetical protein
MFPNTRITNRSSGCQLITGTGEVTGEFVSIDSIDNATKFEVLTGNAAGVANVTSGSAIAIPSARPSTASLPPSSCTPAASSLTRNNAMSYLQSHLSTVERGALGTFASIGSAAVSLVSHLEVYLRVAGLCVGLLVGIVTLISVYHDLRRKQKENK